MKFTDFTKGSDAALARGKKSSDARAIKPEHAALLKKMFYDDTIQTGRDKTWHYLKSKFPDSHPTRGQVEKWLMAQEQYQIDRRPKQTKEIKSINHNIKKPRQLMFADLIQRKTGKIADYILLVVDAFTKKVWTRVVPIRDNRTKTARATAEMMEQIIEEAGNPYSTKHESWVLYAVDGGPEFLGDYKDLMAVRNIKQVPLIPGRPMGNLAERYNQSLQNIAFKKAKAKGHQIVTDLKESTENLNNLHNRALGMTPNEAEDLDTAGIKALGVRLSSNVRPSAKDRDDVAIGDPVRRKNSEKYKGGVGVKFFNENFSREIFIVYRVNKPRKASTRAITYKIKTRDGNELEFNYTREDILKIPKETLTKLNAEDKKRVDEERERDRLKAAKKAERKAARDAAREAKKQPGDDFKYNHKERIIAKRKFFTEDNPGNVYKTRSGVREYNGRIFARSFVRDQYDIKWERDDKTYVYARDQIDDDQGIRAA